MKEIKNRTVLPTGAPGGIGRVSHPAYNGKVKVERIISYVAPRED